MKQSLTDIRSARAGIPLPDWAVPAKRVARDRKRITDTQRLAAMWAELATRYRFANKTPANVSMNNWCAKNAADAAKAARIALGVEQGSADFYWFAAEW